MSDGLNRVILLGNLGADPELRMTSGGKAVLNMRLATSETFKDSEGQRQQRTEWHRLVIWGNRAEALAKWLKRGDRLLAEGRLKTTKYQDKDKNDRYTTEINCLNIVLSGGGNNKSSDGVEADFSGDDDDAPF